MKSLDYREIIERCSFRITSWNIQIISKSQISAMFHGQNAVFYYVSRGTFDLQFIVKLGELLAFSLLSHLSDDTSCARTRNCFIMEYFKERKRRKAREKRRNKLLLTALHIDS